MNPAARADMESRADRALRRGELTEALGLYESLVRAFPADAALAVKLANARELLQPAELEVMQAARATASIPLPVGPSSPVQEGERLFALGDYAGAAACYRRAVQERPDSELLKERLIELYGLAKAMPLQSPTDRALPDKAEPRLQALLDRVASRRRLKRD
ncbi:tetratricopeptide repeat protein [Corallococcus macrosporus]|uniref:TPR repeat-containing protein n=1 Tax=Myxococcus fulvus (strain ATCC BAA-855 / HW-1) TaxID=483219 RepID=F8CHM6_MYXFH|nr:tetratricopeptide repeat protein [Corallococcus macrosporus]AEI67527.1 TPR repeat-containing protein [Corallococcus macrosporus]